MLRLLTILFVLAPIASAQSGSVWYVDRDASGAATGASWADAVPDLQAALAGAASGDEVWVAEGTYLPTDGTSRSATFQLRAGVALFGGFAGTETSRDQRDWNAHPTVLSGDIGAAGVATDNSYHVVTGSGVGPSAVLDGFVITAGYASGTHPRNRGAGMRNVSGSPTVRNCVFRENESRNSPPYAGIGGGMFNDQQSSPFIENVRFEHNRSEWQSAGLGNRNGSSPVLRDVVFLENEAEMLGGGMTNESGSAPVLIGVDFVRNRSGAWTGGLDNYQASPTLYNVRFLGNRCENYGCAMTNDTNGNALVVNALFVGNTAGSGSEPGAGGLQNNGSSPTLVGVTFVANRGHDGAADAIGHRGSGTVTLRNAVLWNEAAELADEAGGALDVSHALIRGGFSDGTSILNANPLFTRMPSPGVDGEWGTADDDYGDLSLQTASPALDAGDAALLPLDAADLDGDGDTSEPIPVDLIGDDRIQGGGLDLGALESTFPVSNEVAPGLQGVRMGEVFPNPARGVATIPLTLSASRSVQIRVLDVLGREVVPPQTVDLPAGEHDAPLVVSGLAPGLYFIGLDVAGHRLAQPLVVAF